MDALSLLNKNKALMIATTKQVHSWWQSHITPLAVCSQVDYRTPCSQY